jgi:hypothetical protein
MLATGFGSTATFSCSRADQIALHVSQAAKNREHEPSSARACVSPRLGQRAELGACFDDLPNDGEQVEGGSGKPVNPGYNDDVAGVQRLKELLELLPV